jgi:hypothetical protein
MLAAHEAARLFRDPIYAERARRGFSRLLVSSRS